MARMTLADLFRKAEEGRPTTEEFMAEFLSPEGRERNRLAMERHEREMKIHAEIAAERAQEPDDEEDC